jgi:hypothetical protein
LDEISVNFGTYYSIRPDLNEPGQEDFAVSGELEHIADLLQFESEIKSSLKKKETQLKTQSFSDQETCENVILGNVIPLMDRRGRQAISASSAHYDCETCSHVWPPQ